MAVRAREVVTRAALGAGRLRIARQFLTESLLLSLAGGLAGAAIARWGTEVLAVVVGSRIPRADETALDWQAFAFLLFVAIAAASLFGLAPALAAARMDLNGVTKESGGHATMGRRFKYLRDGLVVLEVAIAFVLAIGAALVIREIVRLENVDTGMITENVVALHLTPRVPAGDYEAIEARVSRIPGVVGAGCIQMVPLQNWGWEGSFEIRGRPEPAGRRTTELRYVTPGYFRAMGIALRGGREFSAADSADAPRVVIVNEVLARRYFPGEDPVGKVLDRGTIAGVIGDVRNIALDREAVPEIYYPVAQNVAMTSDLGMSLIVRTERPPESLIRAIRSAVLEVNPRLAIFNVRTMSEVVADSLWDLHLYRWLIGLFAILALVLAAIGLHGVISFVASARTREFAIRMALGSGQAAVARLVVNRGIWLSAIGLGFGAAGTAAALTLTASLRALRVGSMPDAATFSVTAILVLLVAAVACAVPALRAATVDPVAALRHE
jgi:putative ABC transport system permease protein